MVPVETFISQLSVYPSESLVTGVQSDRIVLPELADPEVPEADGMVAVLSQVMEATLVTVNCTQVDAVVAASVLSGSATKTTRK